MCKKQINLIFLALVLALIGTGTADAVDLNDPDLVAYWPFDEGSGTVTTDLSQNSYDGTLNGGATWIEGIYGGALQFNGSDAYVSTGQNFLNNLDGFTLAGWVSASNIGTYASLFGQNDLIEFGFTSENGGQLGVWMSGNGWQWLGADYAFPYPSWHHLVLTGDASRVVIYIDGQEAASDEGGMVSGSSGFTFNIGAFVFGESAQGLLGEIDDVWVLSRALTQDEIQTLMLGSIGYPYAMSPDPVDGALLTNFPGGILGYSLMWKSGDFAVSHDVYFGENFDDVNDGTGGTFRGNQTDMYFLAGYGYTPNDPVPTGFVPGKTYYWRIDEVNDMEPNSPWKGDVWSFSLPPTKAYAPTPSDGTTFIDPNIDLNWEPGMSVLMQTVYFGDDYETVSNATTGGIQVVKATTYDPGPLELEKVYYWRVDTTSVFGQITGDTWSFTTTIPGLGTIVSERWENIPGDDLNSLKDNYKYPNNPDVTEVLTEFSTMPGLDEYGGRIHGWVYAPATGGYTFWLCSDNQGELWLSTNDDSTNIELIAQENGWASPNTWLTGEQQSDPIPLQGGEKYYIMALWKEGTGGDQCQVAWQGPGVTTRMIIPGSNLSPYRPLKAFGAKPINRATDVKQVLNLEWKPGIQAASHQVYFGTDEDAVRNATTASPEYIGTRSLGNENYDPGKLDWESTYFWRVDEVNNINPDSPWPGSVWSFTTAGFAIVDDFEGYEGGSAPLEDNIWFSWHDGVGYGAVGIPPYSPGNGTGSEVGDLTTDSYTEESIVHGGGQSMPYWYNNNNPLKMKYSEAKLTLSGQRDWTEQGIKALSLWFQGYPGSVGSFMDNLNGTYTMTGSGLDIWNIGPSDGQYHDEFHFAYKTLTGAGTIVARVDSILDTHDWAKAGVMIRETLDANSTHAFMCVTPASGVSFQRRPSTGATSTSDNSTTGDEAAPHWVRLERDMAGNFTASHSTNGSAWEAITGAVPENIPMTATVHVGLAVTAHNDGNPVPLTCEATFSNVTITGTVAGQWASQDIGIQSNDPEPLYVAIANNTGQPAVVYHDDQNAAQIDTWTEWNIDLNDFTGINLADVNSIAIGFGDRNNPQAGGSGKMYFDDIRLYRPRCVPDKVTLSEADLNSDCVVDFRDLEAVLADQWLDQQQWP
jgi:hypothetical protein